ncbi:hypothetical protein ACFOE1_09570 [Agromyces mediolanus]|uniref:Uncharacterized protein n=1 Tax=Agromyces mediolanus TaxID=41986 RepID=A0A918FBT0_AGRME|nr:hypothetical protein [Agromyces mediolanus]GGR19723.1 hypothetical protein GCM10010196_11140 [Agromyces mediolanus]GLJ71270.1 hypothetical protein GCM10017583_05260 [Agromyces mediolanus]
MTATGWTVREGRAELEMSALRARSGVMHAVLAAALVLAAGAVVTAFFVVDARGGVIGPQPLLLLGGVVFLAVAGLGIVVARPFRRRGVLSISTGSIRWRDSRGELIVPLSQVHRITVRRRFLPGIDVDAGRRSWGLRTSASILDAARDDMRPLSARARRALDEAGFVPSPNGNVTVWERA